MIMKSKNPISIKPLSNVGALLDIPTGTFIKGERGEYILNGGVASVTGTAGAGNMFKSTFTQFLMTMSTNRYNATQDEPAHMHTYDSEDNMIFNYERLNLLTKSMKWIPSNPLYDENVWSVIPKSEMSAEEWLAMVHDVTMEKIKTKKRVTYEGYINRLNGQKITLPKLTSIMMDSFSELESSKSTELVGKGDILTSQTIYMHEGMFKTKLLKDLPRLSNNSNTNFFLTAHTGDEINMASGPFAPQPTKSLQHMKTGTKIKGVAGKIYYLSTHMYHITRSSLLIHPTTKQPEYPRDTEDNGTDLNVIFVKQLRSKTGPSGYVLEIVVSQVEGVKPELTEFRHIKKEDYGIIGNKLSYSIALYPDVKLSRTKVRTKLEEDDRLKRAVNILSEILQMKTFMRQYRDLYIDPEKLYDMIIEQGYDWDKILDTVGWYSPGLYSKKLNYLSTLDILLMAHGKSGIDKKYLNKFLKDK